MLAATCFVNTSSPAITALLVVGEPGHTEQEMQDEGRELAEAYSCVISRAQHASVII
jgi:hypothetical protein